jgi:aminocarboxymuconate-semialdehyde decarboxylase
VAGRREFIAGGAAFVGCSLLGRAHGQAGQPFRREVLVSGKRVKTIDVHAHVAIPDAMALMGMKVAPQSLVMGEERLHAMDAQGIDMAALSINPYWYKAERDVAEAVIKLQNEKLAELCASKPDRFVAFASVALQYPDLAARQLEEGVKKLGLRGGSVGTAVNSEDLADPKFHPFWAKAEELGCLIFMHPNNGGADFEKRLRGNGGLANVIGNPLETTVALSHLIFEGTLDRFPGLKICAAHGGGFLPSYAPRSDAGCVTFPDRCSKPLKKKPTEYLKQLYYDSIVFTPEAMRHLAAQVGSGQIVMGTDYPFPWEKASVSLILGTPGMSDAEREAILGGTAARLLGIKS